MSDDPTRPEEGTARTLSHRRVYEGKVLSLDVDEVEEPQGVRARREVVRQQGSVAVLPVLDDGRIALVRQFRYAVQGRIWELPAGRIDRGEAPEAGGRRELEEEMGYAAERFEPLAVFFTTPGFCDEKMHLFRASGLRSVPSRPEEDERIEIGLFTAEEAHAMIASGGIRDGKTLVALLLEAERRARTSPIRP
jgi:ADP-ribose pyrophosphatase